MPYSYNGIKEGDQIPFDFWDSGTDRRQNVTVKSISPDSRGQAVITVSLNGRDKTFNGYDFNQRFNGTFEQGLASIRPDLEGIAMQDQAKEIGYINHPETRPPPSPGPANPYPVGTARNVETGEKFQVTPNGYVLFSGDQYNKYFPTKTPEPQKVPQESGNLLTPFSPGGSIEPAPKPEGPVESFFSDVLQHEAENQLLLKGRNSLNLGQELDILASSGLTFLTSAGFTIFNTPKSIIETIKNPGSLLDVPGQIGEAFSYSPAYGMGILAGMYAGGKATDVIGGKVFKYVDDKTASYKVTQTVGKGDVLTAIEDTGTGAIRSTEGGIFKTVVERNSLFGLRKQTFVYDSGVFGGTLANALDQNTVLTKSIGAIKTKGPGLNRQYTYATTGLVSMDSLPPGIDLVSQEVGTLYGKKGPVTNVHGKFLIKNIGETQTSQLFASVGRTDIFNRGRLSNVDFSGTLSKGPLDKGGGALDRGTSGSIFDTGRTTKTVVNKKSVPLQQKVDLFKSVVKSDVLEASKGQVKGPSFNSGGSLGSLFSNSKQTSKGNYRVLSGLNYDTGKRSGTFGVSGLDTRTGLFEVVNTKGNVINRTTNRDRTSVFNIQNLGTGLLQDTAQRQRQEFIFGTTPRTGTRRVIIPKAIITSKGNSIFNDFERSNKPIFKTNKPGKKGKEKRGYNPGFTENILDIYGKEPKQKVYSGFESRPLLGKKKKSIFT